jgi:drug/metabolite transporter (DMT)-like permease
MFLVDYACLFWAEQRVPSGVSAVILATIPVAIALLETVVLRTTRFTLLLALELATGIIGVAVLANPSSSLGEAPLDRRGVMALLLACLGWSVGTIITPRLVLPASKAMSAAAQMLSGGVELLALAALSGELGHFRAHQISAGAWFSLLYLIVAGSIIAFTAYVWLLHYEPPSKVGTYAYVNPVVAVIVGAELGGETLGRRTVVGTALILLSVVVITRTKSTARRDLIHNETHTAAD